MVEQAANGVRPVDGGVAIWRDGEFVFGLAEERATRRKYDGGFRGSLAVGLDQLGISYNQVDAYSFVSYGEAHSAQIDHILLQAPELRAFADRVHVAGSHHYAHAIGAAALSPWEDTLVAVLDNEGLILGRQFESQVELNAMERVSFYAASSHSVDLVTRDLFGRTDVSLGEAYRRFTYYCGFPSHQFAGKTMALAAYGDPYAFGELEIFPGRQGPLAVDMAGGYSTPAESVVDFFSRHGVTVSAPRGPGDPITKDHLNAAAFIQHQLEAAVTARLRELLEATGLRTLCVTGGVAYNCKLIGHLERELSVPVFVPPSPGDQGLGVGAALSYLPQKDRRGSRTSAEARLGGIHPISRTEAESGASSARSTVTRATRPQSQVDSAVQSLIAGSIIAIVDGKSEFGRRALGARSFIALPQQRPMQRLRAIKRREWFRPFGVSVLGSMAMEVFDGAMPDRFMLRTAKVAAMEAVEGLVHRDGTLRAQWVDESEETLLALILRALLAEGLPAILVNTSLNLDSEPIVETDSQALDLFCRYTEIDKLILTNSGYVFSRTKPSSPGE
ncbi:carbamoyltransferase C-terminal domain-containing protein [Microbacterium sp. P06]|uniref:carbamoyltransferase C-terminal domain-containing protein n=1 Tax=Microbacterium sp. P06 TaxID=3366949 RepID=UPI003746282C